MVRRLPPLYALRAFEQAARYSSFTQAAQVLSITPSAVSRHIKTLEEDFGCQLFIRIGPRVEVTTAGRILAQQLREGFHTLEKACEIFRSNSSDLRLKAPSTLTMRWLLGILPAFSEENSSIHVQISSVWMDFDTINFSNEPYDCAILLGNGHFGEGTISARLFEELLIPVCSPTLTLNSKSDLHQCELIHPSPDRRDWRRWLKRAGDELKINIHRGMVFDTLEQGNMAAISGHGVSVGDLVLSLQALKQGVLMAPFNEAVSTGDGYYLVWPENTPRRSNIDKLYAFLKEQVPAITWPDIVYLR
ncbi:LysR substrate-binding domain-containing protein [Pectobacteriaceae bacterium CE70]|uniref:LysR family transcriptional regulator n=1 Tax=Serratia sp. (strain ATCC 39006) TaxID=104623 RepID=A0A2I5T276_SERS3|nr:LysR substrate-binding domain-containing protein [Serratia sp. ATCC 39006]AUG98643.1 LysR family transcriptional regulator [Serratia sp. ATCC 39006]AUH02958.1 LysR family transcriptional regulator [Serratia sp. ATCC 39006]WJV67016.1 LysR substrate-binding domain-containing protein [Pectobacteriaceae bacterium CE70]WJY11001.1 LysR substrate-binding domain-containing protein [Pectobacteriaceae bacterium C80]